MDEWRLERETNVRFRIEDDASCFIIGRLVFAARILDLIGLPTPILKGI